jgi:LysR family transcriptional activator of nhaA
MAWLNYHHLLYFWTVARCGTIAAASKELLLSQPTISTQLKTLEDTLGQKLFQRHGRTLALTDVGRTTYRYADEIFRMGRELQEAVSRGPLGQHVRLAVGIVDVIPKLVAQRMLEPAFDAVPELHLDCQESPLPQLLSRLALHEVDLVLADQPALAQVKVKAYSHKLGESGMSFFGAKSFASLAKKFPHSLHGQPVLLQARGTAIRSHVDVWLEAKGVEPKVVGEFDDSALMKVFAERGRGVFAAPTAIEEAMLESHHLEVIGRTDEVRQSYYAISVERRLHHPAVLAIAERARKDLFG